MTSLTDWQIYFHDHATPSDAQAVTEPPHGVHTLASGDTVAPIPCRLKESFIALDTLRPNADTCPNEGFAIAVATIAVDAPQKCHIGFSTDWWFEAYVNGELVGSEVFLLIELPSLVASL